MKKIILQRYEYLDTDGEGKAIEVGYTIRKGLKPKGYRGEQLVQEIEFEVKED